MPKIKAGQKAEWVAETTDYSILKALHTANIKALGGYRFSELLKNVKPKISRDTLARHLKTLYTRKLIGYDRLGKLYFITDEGFSWLKRFERLSLLQAKKWVYGGAPSKVEIIDTIVKTMIVSNLKALTESMQKVAVEETFVKTFSWDVYSDLPIEINEEFKKGFSVQAGRLVLDLASRAKEEAKAKLDKMKRAKLLVVLEYDFKRHAEAQLEWLEKFKGVGESGSPC